MNGLFVYGTLRFPAVLEALLERVPPMEPARAPGWRARALPGAVYPGLIPDPGATTDGRLILGLTPAEISLLDEYEGDLYEPRVIALDGGRTGRAYLWKGPVEERDWDPELFVRRHLTAYVQRCRAWRESRG
ncbi:gamma-glutamylcyclotransferase family protein [Thermomonospora catenispora]|uniref:gamma-glutamylcyclotransferase family protein n=1 Tax=Thermomonospora catenispora TaxID=2493090 RepID=UPI00111E8C80|nr:gamma-glutamylcyclotransferase family protein [Thermomonospora catenispora]TNY38165.1 gamma-glutamylcyclotransferase [Thermomonospora catenispora]